MRHPTAIIHPSAQLHETTRVGPYSIVGEHVVLDEGVVLHSHVVVMGRTHIGAQTEVFPFASLGTAPQDLKFAGEPSTLEIGRRNKIREHVTMNPGTEGGGMLTRVGDDCLFMMSTHVAHDCQVGNHVILANNATLAGHVTVGDFAVIGGLSAVHQFVRIGAHAMIGGMSAVASDVIPYGSVMGERAFLAGLNLVGMKRRGFTKEAMHAVRGLFRTLFETADTTFAERLALAEAQYADMPEAAEMLAFLKEDTSRALCVPK